MIRIVLVLLIVGAVGAAALANRDRLLERDMATTAPAAITPDSGVRGLFVEPDDGREPVLAELQAAGTSIDLLIYLLTDNEIFDALASAESRGVEVRVILEQHPFGGAGNPEETATRLQEAGADVKWATTVVSFSHVKTMVIDRSVALIMTLNLTRSSFEGNREFGVVTTAPADVAEAQAVFDADWSGEELPDTGPLIVSPENSRTALVGLIESAETSLEIYAEVIRDDEIVAAFVAAESRGVRVEIVLTPDVDPVNQRVLASLREGGIAVHLVDDPYIHAKMVLADGERAFVGSQNFTETSLNENREIGIVLSETVPLERLKSTFERDATLEDLPPAE
jgi:cardiolipin synthase A/B